VWTVSLWTDICIKVICIKYNMYKSFVRPHLEYCSPAWSPHYQKDKELLERVQHRFTRMFRHLRQLDYSTRLDILGLWSLEERRNRADLIEVFYIMRGFSLISVDEFFEVNNRDVARPGLGGLKPPQT